MWREKEHKPLMKKTNTKRNMNKFIMSFLLLFAANLAMAQNVARVTDLSMKSAFFNHERQVLIYTPVGYDETERLSVLIEEMKRA